MSLTKPGIEIEYCVKCRWLLRAAWLAQELLVTFENDLGSVSLRPGTEAGVFNVRLNGALIWCRATAGRFPEAKELKQLIKEIALPEKVLGHSEPKAQQPVQA